MPEERLLGDFNNDGRVDGTDATNILGYVNKAMMMEPQDPVTEEDIDAGDVLRIGRLTIQDSTAVHSMYAAASVIMRIYPKTEPANWSDPTNPAGYKIYYYLDENGEPVSLADDDDPAPNWEDKKYFYLGNAGTNYGSNFVPDLLTHLP